MNPFFISGNNHLGGQDFNERLKNHITAEIESKYGQTLYYPDDVQSLRSAVESVKLNLTSSPTATFHLPLRSISDKNDRKKSVTFEYTIHRQKFEDMNSDLFKKVLEPIDRVLEASELRPSDVEEIVLVGGSTRIPKIREIVRDYFGKEPNVSIDPELAVATGVSVQAGIMGGMWPLSVSAIETRTAVKKILLY